MRAALRKCVQDFFVLSALLSGHGKNIIVAERFIYTYRDIVSFIFIIFSRTRDMRDKKKKIYTYKFFIVNKNYYTLNFIKDLLLALLDMSLTYFFFYYLH